MIWRVHHDNRQLMMCLVLISYCVCRRPSWKPKLNQWLSFWFSTRFTRKILHYSNGSYLYLSLMWDVSCLILFKYVPNIIPNVMNNRRGRLIEYLLGLPCITLSIELVSEYIGIISDGWNLTYTSNFRNDLSTFEVKSQSKAVIIS